ncbi:hypothetical protein OKW31_005311 [Paraburkholderia atlantica]
MALRALQGTAGNCWLVSPHGRRCAVFGPRGRNAVWRHELEETGEVKGQLPGKPQHGGRVPLTQHGRTMYAADGLVIAAQSRELVVHTSPVFRAFFLAPARGQHPLVSRRWPSLSPGCAVCSGPQHRVVDFRALPIARTRPALRKQRNDAGSSRRASSLAPSSRPECPNPQRFAWPVEHFAERVKSRPARLGIFWPGLSLSR